MIGVINIIAIIMPLIRIDSDFLLLGYINI
jgi:hypothetical protein